MKPILRLAIGLLLFAVVAISFSGAITDGHLNLDDWGYTVGCPFVRDGLTANGIVNAFTNLGHGGIWMPLTYVSYMADITLFGGGWMAHHAVNVALHAFAAVLVMMLAVKFMKHFGADDDWRTAIVAFLAALVWAVHPMRAEAVAWVASRKEELWTLFALFGLMAWWSALACRSGGAVFAVLRFLAANVFFIAAMLSKPSAVCLPLLVFALERFVGAKKGRIILRYLPISIVAAFVGLIAVISQTHPTGAAPVEVFETPLVWRLLNGLVSLGLYLWKTLLPYSLHLDYRAVIGGWPLHGALGLAVLAASVAAVALLSRRLSDSHAADFVRFSACWFLIALLPVLGIIGTTGDKAYADRYSYLPSVILSVGLALAVQRLMRNCPKKAVAASFAMVFAEMALLQPTVASFRDDVSAYRRVLADDPEHWRALRVIGCDLCARRNRIDEGVTMLRKSLKFRYSQQTAASLAYVLACRGAEGDFADVRRLGGRIALNPKLDREGLMLDALAIAAFREGQDREAVRLFSSALTAPVRSHGNLHAMLSFGSALANVGRTSEALDMFAKLSHVSDAQLRERAAAAVRAIRSGKHQRLTWRE